MSLGQPPRKENIDTESEFVGYRLVEFGQSIRRALQEVSDRLIPHETEIVEEWLNLQFSVWQPPGLNRKMIKDLFGDLFHDMLMCMKINRPEQCISNLEITGANLALKNFPYEALIISFHFLEESYMQFLLEPPSDRTLDWFLGMDEFLHAALAAMATSYFRAYRKELLEEAEVSKIIQEGLLPDIPKHILDLEVAYIYLPSGERTRVGGDFIDVFSLDDNNAAFIVGDLSGHGLEAATDAAMVRSLFRGFIRENQDPTIAMERLNKVLVDELPPGSFATAIAGTYSKAHGIRLVNAGHPSAVLCDGECKNLEAHGLILGVDHESGYTPYDVAFENGAILLVYTDGLTEARGEKGFFGEERVLSFLTEVRDAPSRAVAEYLRDAALRFSGGVLTDDVAILVLKRTTAS